MSLRDYQDAIETNLRPWAGKDYTYRKNSAGMYALLKEYSSIDRAIETEKD